MEQSPPGTPGGPPPPPGPHPLSRAQAQSLLFPFLLGVIVQILIVGVILTVGVLIFFQSSTRSKYLTAVLVMALAIGQTGSDCSRCLKVLTMHFGDFDFMLTPRLEDGLGHTFGAVQQGVCQFTLLWQIYKLAPVSIGIGGGAEVEAMRHKWASVWRSSWTRKTAVTIIAVGILLSVGAAEAASYYMATRDSPLMAAQGLGLPKTWVTSVRIWLDSAVWIDIFLTAILTFELIRARRKTAACTRATAHLTSQSRGDPRSADLPPPAAPTVRSTLSFLLRLIPLSGFFVLVLQTAALILFIMELHHFHDESVAWSTFCVLFLPHVYGLTTLLICFHAADCGTGDSWHGLADLHESMRRGFTGPQEKPMTNDTNATVRRPLVSNASIVTAVPVSRTPSRTSFQFAVAEGSKQRSSVLDPPPTSSSVSGAAAHPFSTTASPCPDDIPGFGRDPDLNSSPIPSSLSGTSSRSPPNRKSSSGSDVQHSSSDAGASSSSGLAGGFWGVQLPSNGPPAFIAPPARALPQVRDPIYAAELASLSTITEETRSVFTVGDSWGKRTSGRNSTALTPRKGSLPGLDETGARADDESLFAGKRATQSSFLQMSSSDSRSASRKSSGNPLGKMPSSPPPEGGDVFVPPFSFIDIDVVDGHPLSPGSVPSTIPERSTPEFPIRLDREGSRAISLDYAEKDDDDEHILPPRVVSQILAESARSRSRLSPIAPGSATASTVSTSSSSTSSSAPPVSRSLTAHALSSVPAGDPAFRLSLAHRQTGPLHKESYLSMRTTSSDGRSPYGLGDEESLPYAAVWTMKDRSASLAGVEEEGERASVRTGLSGNTGGTWGCRDRNGTDESEQEAEELSSRSNRT